MAQKKNPLKKAKILVRPSPASLKIILIILIIWSSVTVREYDATIERVDKKIELTEGGR